MGWFDRHRSADDHVRHRDETPGPLHDAVGDEPVVSEGTAQVECSGSTVAGPYVMTALRVLWLPESEGHPNRRGINEMKTMPLADRLVDGFTIREATSFRVSVDPTQMPVHIQVTLAERTLRVGFLPRNFSGRRLDAELRSVYGALAATMRAAGAREL